MATQQIRNIINSQIDSRLARAEKDVRNEGKKRLKDLQAEKNDDKFITRAEAIFNVTSQKKHEKSKALREALLEESKSTGVNIIFETINKNIII